MKQHEQYVARRAVARTRGLNADVQDFLSGIPLAEALVPGSRLLEIGCGNGAAAVALGKQFDARPFVIDLTNYTWLEREARYEIPFLLQEPSRFIGRGLNPGLRSLAFSAARAQELPFRDGSFAFVFSYWSSQYMVEKELFIEEAYRVLVPGGIAALDMGEWGNEGFIPSLQELLTSLTTPHVLEPVDIPSPDARAISRLLLFKEGAERVVLPRTKENVVGVDFVTCIYA